MSNEPDKVNSGALATMIVIVALATWAIAAYVTSLVREETARLQADGDQNQERPYRQLRAEQESKLSAAPSWADKEAGLVAVSVRSAEALVLEAIRENPLAMSPGNPPKDEDEETRAEGEVPTDAAQDATDGDNAIDEKAIDEKGETDVKKVPAPAPLVAPQPVAPAAEGTTP